MYLSDVTDSWNMETEDLISNRTSQHNTGRKSPLRLSKKTVEKQLKYLQKNNFSRFPHITP